MKKYSKILAFALATIIAASAMTACSGNPAPSAAAPNPAKPGAESTEPVTITVWHTRPESDEPTASHKRILAWADEYNKTNTDKITVEVVGSKKDDAILTSIASGTTPDVFMGYWNTTSTWAANGALLDLTDYVNNDANFDKADFANVGWEQATFNDRIYGVPFIMNTTLLYYRKDLLAAGGFKEPPKTLAELEKMAIELTKFDDAGNVTQAGFVPDSPWQDNVCWPVMTGAEWIDTATNKITFDTEPMKAAYQWQANIYKAIGYDKLLAFKEGFGTKDTEEDAFVTGKVAMTFYSEMKIPPMKKLGKNMEWGVCALPNGGAGTEKEVMLTTNQFKINANCAHPAEAWKVLSDLCGKKTMAGFAEGEFKEGAFYGRKSAVEAVKTLPGIGDEMVQVADIMLGGVGRGFPNSAYVNEYLNLITENMTPTLSGDTTVDEAAKAVQAAVQPLADANPMK